MRFIGSKAHLLKEIDNLLTPHLSGNEVSFVDLFAGSNIVAEYFKNKFAVTTNDLMKFSQALSLGGIALNTTPSFNKLKKIGINDPLKYLQLVDISDYNGGFVTREYSPAGSEKRMYFQIKNAKRIDFIRNTIDRWKRDNIIGQDEFDYLLGVLLRAIPYVSNITGTYGAFLKHWDKRTYNPLELTATKIIDNNSVNTSYSMDSMQLVKKISGDILYIDTPYNNRQYAPNYHVLETIARNDNPELHGITGQRDYVELKSDFAVKRKALPAMKQLLQNLQFSHVIVSYSTDGIIPEKELTNMIEQVAVKGSVEVHRIQYRKYKSKVVSPDDSLFELLYYFQPKNHLNKASREKNVKNVTKASPSSLGYIKSPLNYIGGKYKLLPQIEPLFPKQVDTFVDLFSGAGNVGINSEAKTIYFNDINNRINDMFRYFQNKNSETLLNLIQKRIDEYKLSKTNEKGFLKFRKQYNSNPNPLDLYVLVAYSFNYQFRFNNKLQYNNPFGRNRSHFSDRMAENLRNFVNKLNHADAHFTDEYFSDFDFSKLTKKSFVYADPPYLITTGSYNDGNRGFVNWTEKQEKELYDVLDGLNSSGIRFALSNVIEHKGRTNTLLKKWSTQYNIHDLQYGYQNSSHNTVSLGSREVLITNY
ncbi:Dam family site-specific DNA-(adenine-N6)-methyltransferase [Pediococcus claussenii]|uniref:Site-specific DNA-methyltransferase (adenine-specific) n=1 Tax=Pediococcus claussenii (strain ATCC BAA-344 / DSM 14800 / JCM 18046 / KCTC 3811 / LMG 21948 / P06) TaxID=701521 RepID=G8PBF0_PEDCP|nr:Dam family site-specific DNA-(adenine-N6)-methyltransferase [Pediococcus claussenii]AEV95939.1 modification methylase FokI [Pediococcus claussenii ATCC BAA-344]ANZ69430.1 DNA adenine methylase [Pediococcus claussenii]ANZ71250.1 DNA adenine methylase [Pediococcus claussenii]KRN20544.1 fokIM protein [Pediococcus claussenii]